MGDLRFRVNAENIDLKKLWKNLGYKESKGLNYKEFQKFLNSIIPNMKKVEQSYFFEKMDKNRDGTLTLNELKAELRKFHISLTRKFNNRAHFKKTFKIKPNEEEYSDT